MKNSGIGGNSRRFDLTLLVAAIFFGSVGALVLRQPVVIEASNPIMWIFFVWATLLGGYAMRRMDTWLPEASVLPIIVPIGDLIWRKRGWISLALAAVLTSGVVIRLWPDYTQWDGTLLPWLISLGLVGAGSYFFDKKEKVDAQSIQPVQVQSKAGLILPRWGELAGFGIIAALAIFLRIYRLDVFPPGIYVDETNGALDALAILEGNHVSPFATGWYETPNGYIYYMAGMFKLFGANWYTLKAISILPAVLTVLAVYPLGRMMFGPLAGLAAMLFTAVSRWHLSMSRFGWNETAVPFFQVAATFFLLRGLRERRMRDFAIGGLISGLMVYTYLSSRLALATLGLFFIYWILTDPEGSRKSFTRHRQGLALFGFAFLIATAPLAVTYITDPFTLNNRMGEISIFEDVRKADSLKPLLLNIQDHLRFFHQMGDHQGKHNLPNEPAADPVTGALFAIGLVYGAIRLRDRRRGLLWLWLILGMAGGIFSSHHESPQSYRTLTALPAVTLLAGDVLSRVLRGSYRILPRGITDPKQVQHQRVFKLGGNAFFIFSLAAASIWESSVFIQRQMIAPQVRSWFNPVEFAVANEVVDALKGDEIIYLSPTFYTYSPMRFLVYGYMKPLTGINTLEAHPYRLVRPEDTLPIPPASQDAIFLLDLYYQPVADYFKIYYPNAKIEIARNQYEDPLYVRIIVPKADLAAIQGLSYSAVLADGQEVHGETSDLKLPPDITDPQDVEWSGNLRVDHSGSYSFFANGNLQLTLDGEVWTESRYLCSGLHPVRINWFSSDAAEIPQILWAFDDGEPQPITIGSWFNVSTPAIGLMGTYYRGVEWAGEPVCSRQTPFLMLAWPDNDPFAGEFSAKFSGILRVPVTGNYRLMINADDGARITLDGVVLGESLVPRTVNDIDVNVELTAGDHPIQIDYFQAGGGSALNFKWQPPGGKLEVVPFDALLP